MREDAVTVRDGTGRLQTLPRDQVLAILPERAGTTSGGDSARTPSRVQLVDGQIFPGSLGTRDRADDDHVLWQSTLLGDLRLSLENTGSILLRPEGPGWRELKATANDAVLLANGDVVTGFVAEVGARVVVEREKTPAELPSSRVVAIAFANPPRQPQGMWVWFFDGTVAGAAALSSAPDGAMAFTPALSQGTGSTLNSRVSELRAVLFDASRVRGLGTFTPTIPAAESRRWSPPPKIGDWRDASLFAPDIEIPSPMALEWELPAGASRLGLSVELPQASRVWGDLELVLSLDGRELSRTRVHGAEPTADLNIVLGEREGVPLPAGGRLRVETVAGPSGPVQDRLLLRRPLVLFSPR